MFLLSWTQSNTFLLPGTQSDMFLLPWTLSNMFLLPDFREIRSFYPERRSMCSFYSELRAMRSFYSELRSPEPWTISSKLWTLSSQYKTMNLLTTKFPHLNTWTKQTLNTESWALIFWIPESCILKWMICKKNESKLKCQRILSKEVP